MQAQRDRIHHDFSLFNLARTTKIFPSFFFFPTNNLLFLLVMLRSMRCTSSLAEGSFQNYGFRYIIDCDIFYCPGVDVNTFFFFSCIGNDVRVWYLIETTRESNSLFLSNDGTSLSVSHPPSRSMPYSTFFFFFSSYPNALSSPK